MMDFDFVNSLKKSLGPLRITVDVVARDHSYFLIVDGSQTFRDSDTKNWGKVYLAFDQVAGLYVKQHFTPISINAISDTRVEYEIGNIFDMVKNV